MNLGILLFLFIMFLIASLYKVYLAIPLFIGLVILSIYAIKKGHGLKSIGRWFKEGVKRISTMMLVFMFIGILIPSWMEAGTIPMLVYYGLNNIPAYGFIIGSFILSGVLAMLLGTAFGVAGTVGLVLIIMANVGNVPIAITAGAIFSGAYLGDRNSPMSTSAHLIGALTNTEIYENVKAMLKSSFVPLTVTVVLYSVLSIKYPLREVNEEFLRQIPIRFDIGIIVFLPVIVLIIFMIFKIHIRWAMAASSVVAIIISLYNSQDLNLLINHIFWGYTETKNEILAPYFSSSGLYGMIKLSITVLLSSTYADFLKGLNMLRFLELKLEAIAIGGKRFKAMLLSAIFSASFGCTQTIAIILSHKLMEPMYKKEENKDMMIDIENSSVLLSVAVPWNTSSFVPMALLGASLSYLPFAFFIYLVPIWHYIKKYNKLNKVFTK